jgi:hypothetical protein
LRSNILPQSSNILTLDPKTSLPTGTLTASPDGSAHDHRSGKPIGERYPEIGYDDFYLFDELNDVPSQPTTFDAGLLEDGSQADFASPFITSTCASSSSRQPGLRARGRR